MPARIIKLLILFSFIGICLYFVSINSTPITLSVAPGNVINASVGSIVLGAFGFGIFIAFVAASVFALKSFFREQGFKKREKKRIKIEELTLEAREFSHTQSFKVAQKKWLNLIKQFPESLPLHLQYCQFLLDDSNADNQTIINAIDDAKKLSSDSIEVLLLAAKAQLKAGNKTASLDNLALVLSRKNLLQPTIEAAKLSFELNRFEDCLEYLEKAKEIDSLSEETKLLRSDSIASIIIRDKYNEDERLNALIDHVTSNAPSKVAFKELARLQLNIGQVKESAESLWRLFRINKDLATLREARSTWLSGGYSDNALSAVKTYARETKLEDSWLASLELAKTYLLIGQDLEASKLIDELEQQSYAKNIDNAKELAILRAMIAYRNKDARASAIAFQTVERLELGLEKSPERKITLIQ
jgi:hypothetical protein